ncbi:MAG: DUF86 domain-containing protein [Candidatus Atribacteria bacterium]|nr:DUF86 domain-containing protein [Candidatus Atribacteria bacterium]
MVNKQFIAQRLSFIDSFLRELYKLSALDKASFLSDKRNPAAGESFLRRTLEAIFDIGRHILAKTGYMDMATEYKAIAQGLKEAGIIDESLSKTLVQMAGYRNRLVHLYNLVSDEELYTVICSNLKDIEDFITAIKRYVQI